MSQARAGRKKVLYFTYVCKKRKKKGNFFNLSFFKKPNKKY